MMLQILRWLKQEKACIEGYKWSKQFDNPSDWWAGFYRGDWSLWVLWKVVDKNDEVQLRKLTLAKSRCARLVIHLMTDERSRYAVAVAEQYGIGKATRKELDSAASAAYAAAATAASSAASSAAIAADAAYATAAAAASSAAYAAAYAAATAASSAADARKGILLECAEIVRDIYTFNDVLILLGRQVNDD